MFPKSKGSILVYMEGVSPIIFVLLLKPKPEELGSQIVLGGGAWTDKLGFIRRLL